MRRKSVNTGTTCNPPPWPPCNILDNLIKLCSKDKTSVQENTHFKHTQHKLIFSLYWKRGCAAKGTHKRMRSVLQIKRHGTQESTISPWTGWSQVCSPSVLIDEARVLNRHQVGSPHFCCWYIELYMALYMVYGVLLVHGAVQRQLTIS